MKLLSWYINGQWNSFPTCILPWQIQAAIIWMPNIDRYTDGNYVNACLPNLVHSRHSPTGWRWSCTILGAFFHILINLATNPTLITGPASTVSLHKTIECHVIHNMKWRWDKHLRTYWWVKCIFLYDCTYTLGHYKHNL